jgi:hypothetical protein
MNRVYLDDNIFYIENFLSKENWEYINKLAHDPADWEEQTDVVPQRVSKDLTFDKYDDFWNEFTFKVNNVFSPVMYKTTQTKHLQGFLEYKEDAGFDKKYALGPHKDDDGYKKAHGITKQDLILIYGCVYYVNDDYDGGEIIYTSKGIELKPKPNMLVVHSGSDEYEHAVKQVYNGTRCSVPLFYLNEIIC